MIGVDEAAGSHDRPGDVIDRAEVFLHSPHVCIERTAEDIPQEREKEVIGRPIHRLVAGR
jgi:hypothetical protein